MLQELDEIKALVADEQLEKLQFDFTGEWLPNLHPLKIGNGNYSDVANIRYTKTGVIGVGGYTRINTTVLANPCGRSGFQLRSPYTQKSYVFARNLNAGLANGKVYLNKLIPPNVGDFESSVFHTDVAGAGDGRFIEAPNNNLIYCNGVESLVYGGEENAVASFIRTDGVSGITLTNPVIFTNEIRNILTDSLNIVTLDLTSQSYLVASTRPLSGIKSYVLVANNGMGNVLAVQTWKGATGWGAVSNLIDNTKVVGKTHSVTGTILWDDTINIAKPVLVNGDLYYWYLFTFTGDGTCTVYHTTVKSELQSLVNLWDGTNRICTQCEVSKSGIYYDYTPEVLETSNVAQPIAANFSGLLSTDHVVLMFRDKTTAVILSLIAGFINKNVAALTIYYWDGTSYVSVGTVYDGTLDSGGTISLAQSGTIFWNANDAERPITLFNTFGYAYKFVWSATLTVEAGGPPPTEGVYVDTLYGVPVFQKMKTYKFAFNYRNRVFLVGNVAGKQGNILDYGVKDTVDCYNGLDSSDFGKEIYVGKNDTEVMAAANVFNRFGASLYNSEIILKPNEVYLLDGSEPNNFTCSQISENIGTISPKTLTTAEISFEVTKDAIRNIAIWISPYGPMIFDAAVIVPLRGIELVYFKPDNPLCVNFNALGNAHAWYNPRYYEYNVCLPSGAGQVLCNVWLTYNLIEKKWSKIATGTKNVPQATFRVMDDSGNIYFYGLIDSGYLIRLENGNFWDETERIEGYIITNFMIAAGNVFQTTLIRNLKLIVDCDGTYDIVYTRTDMEISGSGISSSGDLKIFGQLIEEPPCTQSFWDGDDFICQWLNEDVFDTGPLGFLDIDGVVSIRGVVIEDYVMKIFTAGGDFITAGFIPGLLILTSDPNNPGPFLCTDVTATVLTFVGARCIQFDSGSTLTLYAMFVKVEYYDGNNYSLVPFKEFKINNNFAKFISSCNYTNLVHMFKFSFYSQALQDNIRPLAWGLQYINERLDI